MFSRFESLESRYLLAVVPSGFFEQTLVSGLNEPSAMEFAPDGRLFVAEQTGDLRVVKYGVLLDAPFVSLNVDSAGERGLLGVAFDPNFATTSYVYVYYTATSPQTHNRVSRFLASGDTAVPGSEEVLLDIEPLNASNHNGGALHFGVDGKLYVAVGENARGLPSQSLDTLLGKILRLNLDGSIPTDNPFYQTTTGDNRAIWALGLRNPFTFSIHPITGRMLINDVGAATWEEVNEGIAGANYGWPDTEGETSDPRFVSPIYTYDHNTGIAITGGTFYAPPNGANAFPANYANDYFFADFGAGFIKRIDLDAGNAVSTFATGLSNVDDLDVGPDGSLYALERGADRVTSFSATQAPVANQAPVATITSPEEGTTYRAGKSYKFSGKGRDVEDGKTTAANFTWRVDFHHGGEVNAFVPEFTGKRDGKFRIPTTGITSTDVFYRIVLTVTDSAGATSTVFRDLHPRVSTITLQSAPPGFQLTLDGNPITTPFSFAAVVGMTRRVGVIESQTDVNGIGFEFRKWDNGSKRILRDIEVSSHDKMYTARFRAIES